MDKDLLKTKLSEGLSIREISRILEMGYSTVRYWIKFYDIKVDKVGRKKIKKCIECGSNLDIKINTYKNKKFCNNKCQQQWMYKNVTLIKFKNGLIFDHSTLRKILKNTIEYKCQCCKIDKWLNKDIVLQIDHIDGNYLNNKPENLRFLCPNCHTQTENWGIKNKGNGRRINKKKRLNLGK